VAVPDGTPATSQTSWADAGAANARAAPIAIAEPANNIFEDFMKRYPFDKAPKHPAPTRALLILTVLVPNFLPKWSGRFCSVSQ
jgi:hypothetical protein